MTSVRVCMKTAATIVTAAALMLACSLGGANAQSPLPWEIFPLIAGGSTGGYAQALANGGTLDGTAETRTWTWSDVEVLNIFAEGSAEAEATQEGLVGDAYAYSMSEALNDWTYPDGQSVIHSDTKAVSEQFGSSESKADAEADAFGMVNIHKAFLPVYPCFGKHCP